MKDKTLITKFLDETQTELEFIVGNVYALLPEHAGEWGQIFTLYMLA